MEDVITKANINSKEIPYLEFGKKISDNLKLLTDKYNFYYPGILVQVPIFSSMEEIIYRRFEKNKHKCILYYDNKIGYCFFVVYAKNFTKVLFSKVPIKSAHGYNKNLKNIYDKSKNNITMGA